MIKLLKVKDMKFIENITEKEYVKFEEKHGKAHFLQSYSWGQFAIIGKKCKNLTNDSSIFS